MIVRLGHVEYSGCIHLFAGFSSRCNGWHGPVCFWRRQDLFHVVHPSSSCQGLWCRWSGYHPYDDLARFGDYKYESKFFETILLYFFAIYFWEIRIESVNYAEKFNSIFEIWRLFSPFWKKLPKKSVKLMILIPSVNLWSSVCVCAFFLFHQFCDVTEVATHL